MVLGDRTGVAAVGGRIKSPLRLLNELERLGQFIRFCIVGGTGVFVDMGVLYLLADPARFDLHVTLSKVCAAEAAMINNFIWNELWTFRGCVRNVHGSRSASGSVLRRFAFFNAICAIGIALAVLLLHMFHTWLGWNLYFSNLLAIVLVTLWNFGMNARWNWQIGRRSAATAL